MSKKKFKKKKNKKHSHHAVYSSPKPTLVSAVSDKGKKEIVEEEEIVAEPTKASVYHDAKIPAEEEKEYAYVRRDVKKIVIVMGSIMVLLIIAFVVNSKTSAFYSLGNWLYNSLNIQTQ